MPSSVARKRILLTGGTGFIGRNLLEGLGPQYEIHSPKRSELDLLNEVAVAEYLEAYPVDVVVHSATTPGHRNVPLVHDLCARNLRMFFNLARCAHYYGKMIHLSSGDVYDVRQNMVKIREGDFGSRVPIDDHGFANYVIARHIERAERIVELRLFGVFGKYEDYEIRFISNAICKALSGCPITIKQNRCFDYIFVEDLIPIVGHFVENEAVHKSYNVTSGEQLELRALASMVLSASGKDLPVVVARPGFGLDYTGDDNRLRREIPNLQFTPMPEAIQKLYSWYGANLSRIKGEALLTDK